MLYNQHFKSICAVLLLLLISNGDLSAQDTTPEPLFIRQLPQENLLLYLDAQGTPQPVKHQQDWEIRRRQILQGMESVMGVLPGPEKRCDLDVQILDEVDRGSYVLRSITYQSEPGSRVPAYLLIPKDALKELSRKFPAVLALHPTHARGPEGMVGIIDSPNRHYAKELAERGYVVVAPCYPHLGSYAPDLKELGWKSGTLKAVWDNKRALDLLDSLPYVQAGRYAAIGHSLGGHNSVYTAVFDDRIQAIISSCGLDSYVDYYQGNPDVWKPGRGWTQERYMPRMALYAERLKEIPFDFHEMIAALAPRKVLIIAPLRDSNFRPESVDRIAAASRPIYQLYDAADSLQVEHPDAAHDFPPEMREKSYQLIDSVLKP